MKLDLLKKLIKEAVREAVREELAVILSEDVKPTSSTPTVQTVTKYAEHRPVVARPVSTGNPIMDLMNKDYDGYVVELSSFQLDLLDKFSSNFYEK